MNTLRHIVSLRDENCWLLLSASNIYRLVRDEIDIIFFISCRHNTPVRPWISSRLTSVVSSFLMNVLLLCHYSPCNRLCLPLPLFLLDYCLTWEESDFSHLFICFSVPLTQLRKSSLKKNSNLRELHIISNIISHYLSYYFCTPSLIWNERLKFV